jgi:Ulp1 family protease
MPLEGFPIAVDAPNLSKLSELLGEQWIGERIIDACGHIIQNALVLAGRPNTLVFLPCFFATELSNAYRHREFTTSLRSLRDSLLSQSPDFIAFVHNKQAVHWAPCIVSLRDRIVYTGDSLGWDSGDCLLPMIEWAMRDIVPMQGAWIGADLDVPRQPPGSGSCGVISLCTIEDMFFPGAAWTVACSAEKRLNWLARLLIFHGEARRKVRIQFN